MYHSSDCSHPIAPWLPGQDPAVSFQYGSCRTMVTAVIVSSPCCSVASMFHQQQELLQFLRTPKESWGLLDSETKTETRKRTPKEGGMRLWNSENQLCDNLWHLKVQLKQIFVLKPIHECLGMACGKKICKIFPWISGLENPKSLMAVLYLENPPRVVVVSSVWTMGIWGFKFLKEVPWNLGLGWVGMIGFHRRMWEWKGVKKLGSTRFCGIYDKRSQIRLAKLECLRYESWSSQVIRNIASINQASQLWPLQALYFRTKKLTDGHTVQRSEKVFVVSSPRWEVL